MHVYELFQSLMQCESSTLMVESHRDVNMTNVITVDIPHIVPLCSFPLC